MIFVNNKLICINNILQFYWNFFFVKCDATYYYYLFIVIVLGHIGRTFLANQPPKKSLVEFDPDSLSFGEDLEEDVKKDPSLDSSTDAELSYNEIKDAHWFYDTPGIMKEHDVRLPIQTVLT